METKPKCGRQKYVAFCMLGMAGLNAYCRVSCYYTGLRRPTPHHSTGAKLVAQSNVKRLMTHRITSTGMGTKSTSVRLKNGRAKGRPVSM